MAPDREQLPWAQLLARITQPVENLVWYPAVVLFLLIVARSGFFDAWNLPFAMQLVIGMALVLLIGFAWKLRRAAEAMRTRTLRDLEALRVLYVGVPDGEHITAQADAMIGQLRTLRLGAYAPFSQQPLLRALLSLLSGVTGLSLLETLTL